MAEVVPSSHLVQIKFRFSKVKICELEIFDVHAKQECSTRGAIFTKITSHYISLLSNTNLFHMENFHTLQLQREEWLVFYIIVTVSLPKQKFEYYLIKSNGKFPQGVRVLTQILYLQAKKQWAQADYSVLFCSDQKLAKLKAL